jgi:hypothetical protein
VKSTPGYIKVVTAIVSKVLINLGRLVLCALFLHMCSLVALHIRHHHQIALLRLLLLLLVLLP